ncbi:MAG: hypothetical protein RIB59_13025, partial [Rhodospirillales bacterium]
MNYFFMLRHPGLHGEVTLANFPPVDSDNSPTPSQYAYLAWSDGATWHIRSLAVISPNATVTIHEDQLPADMPQSALPVFFLYPEQLPKRLDQLIKSASMNTSPNWRSEERR